MDTIRLKYFCTIADTGSLRKASELLNVSSPALSKAMKTLEDEINVQLFRQEGRNVMLTDAGIELSIKGKKILKEIELIKISLDKKSEPAKEIRIATFEVFSTYFLTCLQHLDWKDKNLTLHEVLPGELEKSLENNQVDIGITYMPVTSPHVDYLKVCSVEMGVFTHKDAFPNRQQPDIPFVVPVFPITGTPTRVRGLDGWPEDAYPRIIKHQVTLMESALELCRQGEVAGYFPKFIIDEHNRRYKEDFQLVRKASPMKGRVCMTDVFIVKRKSDIEDSKTIKQLARAIRLTCKS
jgi:DNA-binding transcriptional LysR family regulator